MGLEAMNQILILYPENASSLHALQVQVVSSKHSNILLITTIPYQVSLVQPFMLLLYLPYKIVDSMSILKNVSISTAKASGSPLTSQFFQVSSWIHTARPLMSTVQLFLFEICQPQQYDVSHPPHT